MRRKLEINRCSADFSATNRALNYAIIASCNCTSGLNSIFYNCFRRSVIKRINCHCFSADFFSTYRAVNYAIVASLACACRVNNIFLNSFACRMSKRVNRNSLAADFIATNCAVNHIIIRTVICTIGCCVVFNNNVSFYVFNGSFFSTLVTRCIACIIICMLVLCNVNSNCRRSTEVIILNSDLDLTGTYKCNCTVLPARTIINDSCGNRIVLILIDNTYSQCSGNKLNTVINKVEDVAKLNSCVIGKLINLALKLNNGLLNFTLNDIKVSYNSAILCKTNAAYTPAIAGKELMERQINCSLVFSIGVIVVTSYYGISLIRINNAISVRICKYELGVRNAAELVIRRVRSKCVLLKLTVIIVVPITKVNGTSVCTDTRHIRNGSTVSIRCIMSDGTDDHTCIAVCVILIVSANVVINVYLRRNVTVFKADGVACCISLTINVSAIHTNETAASNVPRAPKSTYLVGIINGDVLKRYMVIVSSACATCDTDDTAVTGIINSGITAGNCNIFKRRITRRVSRNNTRRSIFTVRGEIFNSKVLDGTAVYVSEDTHSFLIIVSVVIASHLPGVLVDIFDGVTVSVEYALECATVCIPNGSVLVRRNSADIRALTVSAVKLLFVKVFFNITSRGSVVNVHCHNTANLCIAYGIEDYTVVNVLCSAEIYVSDKLIVLVTVIFIVVGDQLAKKCKLVSVGYKIRIILCSISACKCLCYGSVPSVYRICNESYLREGRHRNGKLTRSGIIEEFVMNVKLAYGRNGRHLNSNAFFHVIKRVVTNVQASGHNLAEIDDQRYCVIGRNAGSVHVK